MASFKWSSGLQLAAAPEDNVIQSPAALTFRCQLPRPQSMLPPFASVALAIGKRFATEPKTGIDFPTEICHRTKTACPSLNGIGVRKKSIAGPVGVNVYALGIYVDEAAAKNALSKYRTASPAEAAKSQKFYDDVMAAQGVDKTLRLVIHYGSLKRSAFVSALEERLAPALNKAGELSTLKQFRAAFDGVDFSKGTEVVFSQVGGTLTTKVGGAVQSTISSPVLCAALLAVYLGPDPVAKDAKVTFGSNLAAAIKA